MEAEEYTDPLSHNNQMQVILNQSADPLLQEWLKDGLFRYNLAYPGPRYTDSFKFHEQI